MSTLDLPLPVIAPPALPETAPSTALKAWQGNAFYDVSLRDLGTAALDYDSKEALVADMMLMLSQQSVTYAQALAPANIAQRFLDFSLWRLEQLANYRPAVAALFAASVHPQSHLHPLHGQVDDPLLEAYRQVVARATDMPTKADEVEQLSLLLYGMYHFIVFFWLFDRSSQHRATTLLVDFLHDVIRMARPMLMMPMAGKALVKVSQIMQNLFKRG